MPNTTDDMRKKVDLICYSGTDGEIRLALRLYRKALDTEAMHIFPHWQPVFCWEMIDQLESEQLHRAA